MEQEFVAKRRKRALGDTRALPRHPPPDGKRPLFPAIFPDQLAPIVRNVGDGRSGALHDALGMSGPPQYDGAPVMNMPAPILTTTAALVFRLNLQWHNHVLRSATHFDTPPCRWPVGNRVGSAEHFVNPDRVEMSGFA